jgi:hypothetical protein
MADKKISQLTAATTPLAGTEVLPIVQSGSTVKVSAADVTAGRAVSAASVAVTGSGVPANGVYLPAANTVGVSTNNALKVSVNASGQMGIGLTPYTSVGGNGGLLQIGNPLANVGAGLTIGATTTGDIQFSDAASGTGQYAGLIRYSHSTNALSFWTDSASRVTLSSTGDLAFNAAKGIDFSANTGAAGETSSLLNWYEEGTFTPVVADATSGGNSASVGTAVARYTRIGRTVFIQVTLDNIDTTGLTAGNVLSIRGLPFAAASGVNSTGSCTMSRVSYSYNGWRPQIDAGSSTIQFTEFSTTNANYSNMLVSNILATTSDIYLAITYTV